MALDLSGTQIVDLSPSIVPGLEGPGTVGKSVEATVHSKPIPEGTHWQGTSIDMYTHTGAHIDSLIHVRAGGWRTEDIALDQVIGEAVVLDFSDKGASEPIEVADFQPHAERIRPGDMVLLRTDWGDKCFGRPEYFSDSPYVAQEGVEWLVERQPKLVGFDFIEDYCIRDRSYDPRELYCHQLLMGAGIPIIEQLVNLAALPTDRRFLLFAPFVKLFGSDGAMARVFALVEKD